MLGNTQHKHTVMLSVCSEMFFELAGWKWMRCKGQVNIKVRRKEPTVDFSEMCTSITFYYPSETPISAERRQHFSFHFELQEQVCGNIKDNNVTWKKFAKKKKKKYLQQDTTQKGKPLNSITPWWLAAVWDINCGSTTWALLRRLGL